MPQGEISVLPWTELEGLHRETSLIQVCHILTLFRLRLQASDILTLCRLHAASKCSIGLGL